MSNLDSTSDRVSSLLQKISYCRVTTHKQRHEVFRLRYECYSREGIINHQSDGLFSDQFDEDTNAITMALYIGEKIAASIRLHIVTRQHFRSPTSSSFPDIVGALVSTHDVLIDPNRFVVCEEASSSYPELHFATLRLPFIAAGYFGASIALAAVRTEHLAFYRRYLHYKQIAGPRAYPGLKNQLALATVNYIEEAVHVVARNPFFAPRAGEAATLFGILQPLVAG